MTSAKHFGCADRIAEAAQKIYADVIVNVQGDEPTVMPAMIERFVTLFRKRKNISCVNMMMRIKDKNELADPNVIKVVVDSRGYALYFSRAPVPFKRFQKIKIPYFKQTGLYAYTKDFLAEFSKIKPTLLEKVEGIDLLRALENGYKIKMEMISGMLIGVDTPTGLARAEKEIAQSHFAKRYLKGWC